jgi:hypothetical protein
MDLGVLKMWIVAGSLLVAAAGLTGCADAGTPLTAAEKGSTTSESAPAAEVVQLDEAETEFLRATRASMRGMEDATDAGLVAAGHQACESIAGGTPADQVDVLPDSMPVEIVEGWNDRNLAGLATQTLCTEYNVVAG